MFFRLLGKSCQRNGLGYVLASILAVVTLVGAVYSQEAPVQPVSSTSSVAGLELPPDHEVNYDEGFVNIRAKCTGEVKWLVVAGLKVKYISVPQTNSIIISVPPSGGVVSVFAVGLIDGKMTDFARCNITVVAPDPCPNPGPGPNPNPNPNPGPNPDPGPGPGPNPLPLNSLHLTFFVDMNNTTPPLAKLLNSESLRAGINQRGHWFRLYDIKSDIVAKKKLDTVVAGVGGNAVLVIQSNDGRVLVARPIPATENEIFALIEGIRK